VRAISSSMKCCGMRPATGVIGGSGAGDSGGGLLGSQGSRACEWFSSSTVRILRSQTAVAGVRSGSVPAREEICSPERTRIERWMRGAWASFRRGAKTRTAHAASTGAGFTIAAPETASGRSSQSFRRMRRAIDRRASVAALSAPSLLADQSLRRGPKGWVRGPVPASIFLREQEQDPEPIPAPVAKAMPRHERTCRRNPERLNRSRIARPTKRQVSRRARP